MRSRRHRVVAGVCGGLGRYFDVDPVIFRIVLAVLALTGGMGLLLYSIAWLFVPVEGETRNEAQRLLSGRVEGPGMAAILVALAGCGVFLSTLGSGGGPPFPLLVIGAVLAALYWSQQRRREGAAAHRDTTGGATGVADAPPAAQPPPWPGTPSWWKEAGERSAPGTRPYLWGPDDRPETGDHDGVEQDEQDTASEKHDRGHGRSRPPAPWFFWPAAVVGTAAGIGAAQSHPETVSLQIGSAAALAVLGVGLVVGSLVGRVRAGAVTLALATAVLVIGSSAAVHQDWPQKHWRPASAAEVHTPYRLSFGRGDLDLTNVDPRGRTVRVRVEVSTGLVRIRVPGNARVDIRADTSVGVVRLPTPEGEVFHAGPAISRHTVLEPLGPKEQRLKGGFSLEVAVSVGQVEVVREAS